MQTINVTVENVNRLPECWFEKGKVVTYHAESRYQKTSLPTVEARYAQLLAELKIPFVSEGEELRYWDSEVFEEEKVRLPMYVPFEGGYRYVRQRTGKILSQATIEAAFALEKVVSERIPEFNERAEMRRIYKRLKNRLEGNAAVGIDYEFRNYHNWSGFMREFEDIAVFPVYKQMSEERKARWRSYCEDMMTEVDEDDYKLTTDCIAIFDMTKVQRGQEISLKVANESAGLYIGRGGWQVKEWSKKLGVRKINIEEI